MVAPFLIFMFLQVLSSFAGRPKKEEPGGMPAQKQ